MTDDGQSDDYLLISVGSGLSPIYSIYQSLIQSGDYGKIAWMYGERRQDNLLTHLVSEWTFNECANCRHRCYLSKEEDDLPLSRHPGRVQ